MTEWVRNNRLSQSSELRKRSWSFGPKSDVELRLGEALRRCAQGADPAVKRNIARFPEDFMFQ